MQQRVARRRVRAAAACALVQRSDAGSGAERARRAYLLRVRLFQAGVISVGAVTPDCGLADYRLMKKDALMWTCPGGCLPKRGAVRGIVGGRGELPVALFSRGTCATSLWDARGDVFACVRGALAYGALVECRGRRWGYGHLLLLLYASGDIRRARLN